MNKVPFSRPLLLRWWGKLNSNAEIDLFLVAVHDIGLTGIRYASDNPMNLAFPNILLHPI